MSDNRENQNQENNEEGYSICQEIAAAESIPEIHKEAPRVN